MSSQAEACAVPAATDTEALNSVGDFEVVRHDNGETNAYVDRLAEEMPVALLYNGEPHVVMLASPQDLHDFAVGFSITEGIVEDAGEIEKVEVRPQPAGINGGVEVHITIPFPRAMAVQQRQRNLAGRSGCGLCGAAMLEDAIRQPPTVGNGPQVSADTLHDALNQIRRYQPLNAETGSIHAAAWISLDGGIELLREDIGRHNALDKLIGALMRREVFNPAAGFIIVTSRASYEMVVKTAMVGVTCMAAISAPTGLAVRLAQNSNMTLIGFARDQSHVIYSDAQQLLEQNAV